MVGIRAGCWLLLAALLINPTFGAWFGASWFKGDSVGDQDGASLAGLWASSNSSVLALEESQSNAKLTQEASSLAANRADEAEAALGRSWLRSAVLGARSLLSHRSHAVLTRAVTPVLP